ARGSQGRKGTLRPPRYPRSPARIPISTSGIPAWCGYRPRRTKADNAAARNLFEDVTRLQPDSPVGPAYLCFTYWADAFRGWIDAADAKAQSLSQADQWAERAMELSGSNGMAHLVLVSGRKQRQIPGRINGICRKSTLQG